MNTRPMPALLAILLLISTTAFAETFPAREEFGQTRPAGRATITETSVGGNGGGGLIVSNIGSSGEDGIEFDPGTTRGAIGPIRWMAPEFLVNRQYTVVVTGLDASGTSSQFSFVIREQEEGFGGDLDQSQVSFNPLSSGVSSVTMTIRSNGNPLYTGGQPVSSNPMFETSIPPTGTGAGGQHGEPYDEFGFRAFALQYPPGTVVRLPGGETFVADEVTFAFDPYENVMVSLDLLSILGTEPQGSTGELFITDWPAGMFGQTVATLGGARGHGLGSSGHDLVNLLRVSNIGSSGEDGVYMHTDGTSTSQGFALDFPSSPLAGHKLFVGGLSYSEGDGTGMRLPVVRCEYMADSFFDVWTELSKSVAPSRIEYLLDGEVVHTVQNPTGGAQLYTSVQYPYKLDCMPAQDGGIDVVVFFSAPVTFQDDTGIDQNCDGVRLVHPPDPVLPFDPLDGIFLRAADLPGGEFFVTGLPNDVPPDPASPWTSATAQGNANLVSPGDGTLRMDNIGSSGEDGVRVSFPPAPDQGLVFSILAGRPPNGHVTVLKAFGTPAGFKGAASSLNEIGELRMDGSVVTGPIEYSADFSILGQGTVVWNFYDDGVLVESLQRGNSDTCFGCDWIPEKVTTAVGYPDSKPRMVIDLPDDTPISVLGGSKAGPAMNKADLVEVIYDGNIVTPFTDVTDLMLLGVAHGTTFLSGMGSTGISVVPGLTGASVLRLHPAAPNPFNPRTVIAFDLARDAEITLQVFDLRGHLVRQVFRGRRAAGSFRETWDGLDEKGRSVASGTYFFRLSGGGEEQIRKAVLVR